MNKKNIIVSQAEQIIKSNKEIDRLKNQIYDLKKQISADMVYVNTSMADIKELIDKNEINTENFSEVYKKLYLRSMLWIEGYPKTRIINPANERSGEVNNNIDQCNEKKEDGSFLE